MSEHGFPNYVPQTNESGVALYAFVMGFTLLSFLLIAPLVVWGRGNEKRQRLALAEDVFYRGNVPQNFGNVGLGQLPPREEPPLQQANPEPALTQTRPNQTASRDNVEDQALSEPVQRQNRAQRMPGGIIGHLDSYATSSYPDDDLDFILSAISAGSTIRNRAHGSNTMMDGSSASSAATTSRLYCRATRQQPHTRVSDVHGRRWKPRRPIGRADTIHHAIQSELQATMAASGTLPVASRCTTGRTTPPVRHREDTLQLVLSRGPANVNTGHNGRLRFGRPRHHRSGSSSSGGSGTNLPPVEDDITPNDAADAGDPGRPNAFAHAESEELTVCFGPNALWKPGTLVRVIDGAADLANPNGEMKRILILSIPLTLGAIADSLFQLIIVAVISHSIGPDSMAAFLLVSLFLGISDDLVGAIADAESTLCSHALSMGDMHLTGQYVQIAVCCHLIVYATMMVVWACYMGQIVEWLVDSQDIASIALSYTRIAIFQHLLQTISRTVTVLFHLVGSENFETQADLAEGLFSVILVACFLPLFGSATLDSVGWIQLTTAIFAFAAKVVHATSRGWSPMFWRGLTKGNAFRNIGAVKHLIVSSLPLFIGAFLEYGEWELLVVFVSILGPAEVVAWTLLGVIWKILESSTEGVGEAASVRVAYHLGTGNPKEARLSSFKSCFVAVVQSILVTSTLFMLGKNLTTWLTTDVTLQNLVNDVLPLVGIGNIVMNVSFICWNLVGAQGRYRLATSVVLLSRWLVTIPIAAVFAYALTLDLSGTMAASIVGFDTSCTALSYILLRSDWERLSRMMEDINAIGDVDSDEESDHGNDEVP